MLKVKNLEKIYTTKKGVQTKALGGVTLDFPDCGLVFVLGKSGSGKSTLLNLLGGLDKPTSGEIIIEGRSSSKFKESDFNAYRNTYVGFIFQEYNLIDNYTVGANISLALELQGKRADRQAVDGILSQMGLTDGFYERRISELSGGQKQRVAVARALIKNPKIILADEPTGALDSQTGKELYELLKELSKERLIIVVSHDRESAKIYGDRIVELADGKVVGDSNPCPAPDRAVGGGPLFKGRLPFRRVLTMGFTGVGKKKFRLILSVFLAVISLSVFVFTVSAMNADVMMSELKTAYDNGAKTVTVTAHTKNTQTVEYADGSSFDREYEYSYAFSSEQLAELRAQTDIFPVKDALTGSADEYLDKEELPVSQRLNPYLNFSHNFIPRYIVVDGEAKGLGLLPVTTDSRLPKTSNEIAVTDYHADIFMRLGYKDVDGEGQTAAVQRISSPQELLGKTIYGRTVVGVYSTEESLAWLKQYDQDFDGVYLDNYSDNFYLDRDGYFYDWSMGDHMIKSAFIGSDGNGDGEYMQVIYRLTGNASADKKVFDRISYHDASQEKNDALVYYRNEYRTVRITTAYSGFTQSAWIFTDEMYLTAALVVSIVIAIFSALLLTNFLLATTEARKREIGILRALGAGKADTVRICLAESATIGLIDFILSLVVGALLCLIVNKVYRIYLFGLGALPVLYLFLLCFGVAALATVLPAYRIAKRKPVDTINNQ